MASKRNRTVGIAALALVLTACHSGETSRARPSPALPSSFTASPSEKPTKIVVPRPAPCSLVDLTKLPQLKLIADTTPKREPDRFLQRCVWESHRGRKGGTILQVAVGDYRPLTSHEVPDPDPTLKCQGEIITIAAGKYCEADDGESVKIVYHNLYLYAIWADAAMNRISPADEQVKQKKKLGRDLAEQIFNRLQR